MTASRPPTTSGFTCSGWRRADPWPGSHPRHRPRGAGLSGSGWRSRQRCSWSSPSCCSRPWAAARSPSGWCRPRSCLLRRSPLASGRADGPVARWRPDRHPAAAPRGEDSCGSDPCPTVGAGPAGTEGATFPFWSPDSRYLAFFAGGKLKKIDASGGPPETICDAPPVAAAPGPPTERSSSRPTPRARSSAFPPQGARRSR